MTKTSQPLLHLQDIDFYRDWQVIFHKFNLEIQAGQWVIVRGVNGCGKTTLLRLCAGLLQPTSGQIHVTGTYSYIGHMNGMKSTQTLKGFLKGLKNPVSKKSAEELIVSLALTEYNQTPFYQLSAGLKRRIALVYWLTPVVDLYIVDEPLTNLDPISCQLVWQLLIKKINAGAAILMAHHGSNFISHPAIQEIYLDV